MKDEVVRAGKYASLAILLVSALSLLIPLLLLVSFLGLVLVLPLGCGLAGFLYLRNYAGMIYRKLPIPDRSMRGSEGRIMLAPFSALPPKHLETTEASEEVDQEFDAVVVSIPPAEVVESEAEAAKVSGAETILRGPALSSSVKEDSPASTRTAETGKEKEAIEEREKEEPSKGEIVGVVTSDDDSDQEGRSLKGSYGEPFHDGETDAGGLKNDGGDQQVPADRVGRVGGDEQRAAGKGEGEEEQKRNAEKHKSSAVASTGFRENAGHEAADASLSIGTHEKGSATPKGGDRTTEGKPTVDPLPTPPADHATGLLPNQANEQDIWICKDCGWKYPNAKPSAKIRRNHKKHCEGRSSTDGAPEQGVSASPLPDKDESREDESRKDAQEEKPSGLLLPESPRSATESDSFRSAPDYFTPEEEDCQPQVSI